jgi:hypothetical protein
MLNDSVEKLIVARAANKLDLRFLVICVHRGASFFETSNAVRHRTAAM